MSLSRFCFRSTVVSASIVCSILSQYPFCALAAQDKARQTGYCAHLLESREIRPQGFFKKLTESLQRLKKAFYPKMAPVRPQELVAELSTISEQYPRYERIKERMDHMPALSFADLGLLLAQYKNAAFSKGPSGEFDAVSATYKLLRHKVEGRLQDLSLEEILSSRWSELEEEALNAIFDLEGYRISLQDFMRVLHNDPELLDRNGWKLPTDFGIDGVHYLLSKSDVSNPKILATIYSRLSGRLERIQALEHVLSSRSPDRVAPLQAELARLQLSSGVPFDDFYKEAWAHRGFGLDDSADAASEDAILSYIKQESIHLSIDQMYQLYFLMRQESIPYLAAAESTWFRDNLPRFTEEFFQRNFGSNKVFAMEYKLYHRRHAIRNSGSPGKIPATF